MSSAVGVSVVTIVGKEGEGEWCGDVSWRWRLMKCEAEWDGEGDITDDTFEGLVISLCCS